MWGGGKGVRDLQFEGIEGVDEESGSVSGDGGSWVVGATCCDMMPPMPAAKNWDQAFSCFGSPWPSRCANSFFENS